MKARWLVLAAVAMLAAWPAAAQEKKDDRFEKAVFDPQLVLQRARDIGLSSQQRTRILDVVKKIQAELVPLQLDMAEPAIDLVDLLEQGVVDEAAALAKVDLVLRTENEVKKRQLVMLIRIKNILTPEQQARLRAIRDGKGEDSQDGDATLNNQEGMQ
ncbi:MAG: hypothetical protein R2882_13665 [Gemmatimonadales bacterium]